jgi:hypothetical protein
MRLRILDSGHGFGTKALFALIRAVLAAGASRRQIEDALAVCFSFNVIGRLADAFGFFVRGPKAFEAGAKYLLARGYR